LLKPVTVPSNPDVNVFFAILFILFYLYIAILIYFYIV